MIGRASAEKPIGATRQCPHCKAMILESAMTCPACRGHLRYDVPPDREVLDQPLKIEGSITHPPDAGAWEYCMVAVIKNERGEEVERKVIGVGAMKANETRTFSLSVDVVASKRMRSKN